MTRKDIEKDADRPHYYSQFWLDVAAGRRIIGAPKPETEAEEGMDAVELEMPEPISLRKTGRSSIAPASDGYKETVTQPVVEPSFAPDENEVFEPESEEVELASDLDDIDLPNILVDDTLEDTDISDIELPSDEIEEEEEDLFDEDEEEEEEDEWGIARGRKKPKPGRQAKPPKSTKKPRRDTRRGGPREF